MAREMRSPAIVILPLLAACFSMTPQVPPDFAVSRPRFSQGVIESVPYLPTRVVVRTPDAGDVVVRSRFETTPHPSLYLLGPRYGFTHRLGDRVQWGGAVGLSTLGADLRARPWDLPAVVALGAQIAQLPALADGRLVPWDVRALVGAQPTLGHIELLLGAGLSIGKRQHDVYLPDGDVAQYGVDQQLPATLIFERNELLGEGLVGVAFELGLTRVTLAVQPFYVVAHGSPTLTSCTDCLGDDRLVSAEANWGATFTLVLLR
jgi:hypothetical protein